MSFDRFVHLGERRPTREELEMVLGDYLGCDGDSSIDDTLAEVRFEEWGWVVTLRGKVSFPFRRIDPRGEEFQKFHEMRGRERMFDVSFGENSINVRTQDADEFTNNVARGFAELCARYWQGTLT